jgi:serine/threonine protein kinase/tetratricopeptide (TPR) repeat protein
MPGNAIGPYQILEKLGAGGMGEVYLAHDPRLGRRVALKSVSSSSIGSTDARASLLREARAAAKLNHPNIAAVYDVLDEADGLHIVMEYVEGESASSLIRRRHLSVDRVVDIGIQLMDALEDAHAHGVLHRDIKPGNMMITPQGRVKVLDFGLAKISSPIAPLRREAKSAESHVIAGTLGYMAPERLLHRDADQRADLYAAGALLFEMLTGRLPYEETDYPALAVLAMTEVPPAPNALNPKVPESLSSVVLRALAREPGERYGSAAEFKRDLIYVADGLAEAVTGAVDSEPPRAPEKATRQRTRSLRRITSAVAALIVAIIAWIVWTNVPPPMPAQAFGERDWVLIADFDNNTGEPLFEHTLRTTLETALQQSRYVNVFPRTQVFDALRRMRAANAARIDEARAVEIAKRENIKVVLSGSALASGSVFQLSMRAVEASNGNLLFAEMRRFRRREQLFDQVDSLALTVREKLGEAVSRTGSQTHHLAQVTTSSLEALELYSRAVDELARGGLEKSRDLLEAAVTRDPDFAMAHVRLGDVYTGLGQFEKTRQHYTRAYALRDHVTDRESLAIQSKYYEIDDDEKARDSWRVLTQLYPDDVGARIELATELYETGDFEAAVPELRHALTLNPFHGPAHLRLVLLLARLGRPDEAISAYEQAAAKGIDNPFVLWGGGLARMARGENDMARVVFTRLAESGGSYRSLGELYLAQLDSYEGKLTAARGRLEAGLVLDVKLANLANELLRHYLLGRLLLLQGDLPSAAQQARAILTTGKENLIGQNLYQAGSLLVRAGSIGPARDVLRRLERMHSEIPTPFYRTILEVLRGDVALAGGHLQDAETAFKTAASGYPGSDAHEGLARVYTRRQNWSAAREEWNRVIALRGDILQVGFAADWPLAHLALARACRDAGDRTCATSHYETFLKLWQLGDAVAPRREAEAELRLAAR